jgi:predicted RNase H-like nuclease
MEGSHDEFVGVDGCPAGWVAVVHARDGRLGCEVVSRFEAVVARYPLALILVDVPIGLRDAGPDERRCDREARHFLKERGSSVFPAPVRAALYAADHQAASLVNRGMTEGRRGLSRQSWAIAPKIREVNEYLAGHHGPLPTVREMHPELCFWALKGRQPLQHNKKNKEGYQERIALLSNSQAGSAALVDAVLRENRRSVVRRDDVVDALVGSVTAWLSRGHLATLPECPERDSVRLPMEMVYFPIPTPAGE